MTISLAVLLLTNMKRTKERINFSTKTTVHTCVSFQPELNSGKGRASACSTWSPCHLLAPPHALREWEGERDLFLELNIVLLQVMHLTGEDIQLVLLLQAGDLFKLLFPWFKSIPLS